MEPTPEQDIKLFSPDLLLSFSELKKTHDVEFTFYPQSIIFILLFRELFYNHDSDNNTSNESGAITASNWTYIISYSFLTVAKAMNLKCIFEAEGKRDAVIKTNYEKPESILFCEWEWNYKSVFGRANELDKLITSTKKSKMAIAFLFTYVPEKEYNDYINKVIEYWRKKYTKGTFHPITLMTVLYNQSHGIREFCYLRTCTIFNDVVQFWEDKQYE